MHDCPCCGEEVVYSDNPSELCDSCESAGCEPHECGCVWSCGIGNQCDEEGVYLDCQVPQCFECGTRASLMNDGFWHSNCEEDECTNANKSWPATMQSA